MFPFSVLQRIKKKQPKTQLQKIKTNKLIDYDSSSSKKSEEEKLKTKF